MIRPKIIFFILVIIVLLPVWESAIGGRWLAPMGDCLYCQNVQQEWVERYNDSYNLNDAGLFIKTDYAGNIYVAGYSSTDSQFLNRDIIVIKYNTNGVQQWANRYNGPGNNDDEPKGMVIDDSANVYITGKSVAVNLNFNWVTIKYNTNGIKLWEKRYDSPENIDDEPESIALDNLGYLYVTGYIALSGNWPSDVMTIKYNAFTGDSVWTARFHENPINYGTFHDIGEAVAVDKLGNVIVTGGSDLSGFMTTGVDYLTIKYNSNGIFQWLQKYDGPIHGNDLAYLIDLDTLNNIFISGFSSDSNISSICTIKYLPTGSQVWIERAGFGHSDPSGMVIDKSGNIYITGVCEPYNNEFLTIKYNELGDSLWTKTFYAGNGWSNAIALDELNDVYVTGQSIGLGNNYDYTTLKYSSNGVQQWVIHYNGTGNSSFDNSYGITVDSSKNVFVTGGSIGTNNKLQITTIKYSQPMGIISNKNRLCTVFLLNQNYPNPFNPTTKIIFNIPLSRGLPINKSQAGVPERRGVFTALKIYDILGREVATIVNEELHPGTYEVEWDGSNYSSGIYFYKIFFKFENENITYTKCMVLIK